MNFSFIFRRRNIAGIQNAVTRFFENPGIRRKPQKLYWLVKCMELAEFTVRDANAHVKFGIFFFILIYNYRIFSCKINSIFISDKFSGILTKILRVMESFHETTPTEQMNTLMMSLFFFVNAGNRET